MALLSKIESKYILGKALELKKKFGRVTPIALRRKYYLSLEQGVQICEMVENAKSGA